MLQNHFIVSLVVLRPFVFQCSAQTHQLRSIPIACDCFSRFYQFIIHYAELVPPNTEHDLGAVNIRFGRRRGSMAENSPWFSWDYRNEPIFCPQSQCDAEIPSIFAFQLFTSKQTPFNISRLQFVQHPISLLLNHSHGFWNGLLSHSQWSCQFFLILTRVLLK